MPNKMSIHSSMHPFIHLLPLQAVRGQEKTRCLCPWDILQNSDDWDASGLAWAGGRSNRAPKEATVPAEEEPLNSVNMVVTDLVRLHSSLASGQRLGANSGCQGVECGHVAFGLL